MREKSRCEAQQERERIPEWHPRTEALRQCLSGSNVHRIVEAADARMKENGHGNFVPGHRAGNDNSGNLKSINRGSSHTFAETGSVISIERYFMKQTRTS